MRLQRKYINTRCISMATHLAKKQSGKWDSSTTKTFAEIAYEATVPETKRPAIPIENLTFETLQFVAIIKRETLTI